VQNAQRQKLNTFIIGAGGHGRVIADCLRAQHSAVIIGFLDDSPSSNVINGIPVLGKVTDLELVLNSIRNEKCAFIVGIGDNLTRRHIVSLMASVLKRYDARFISVVHPSAFVSPLGACLRIMWLDAGIEGSMCKAIV